jgi:hypothetical protein
MSEKTFVPGGKSPYAHRKARRQNGSPMAARERMPWFYQMVTQDFAQREREQEKIRASGKKLSNDPSRPWGEVRDRRGVDAEQAESAAA